MLCIFCILLLLPVLDHYYHLSQVVHALKKIKWFKLHLFGNYDQSRLSCTYITAFVFLFCNGSFEILNAHLWSRHAFLPYTLHIYKSGVNDLRIWQEGRSGMSYRKRSRIRLPVHHIASQGRGTAGSFGTQGNDNIRN